MYREHLEKVVLVTATVLTKHVILYTVSVLLVDVHVDIKGIRVVQVCGTGDYFNIYLLKLNIYTIFNLRDTKELGDTKKLNRRRTDNGLAKRNKDKSQITVYKT